jgi:hypothetical protein
MSPNIDRAARLSEVARIAVAPEAHTGLPAPMLIARRTREVINGKSVIADLEFADHSSQGFLPRFRLLAGVFLLMIPVTVLAQSSGGAIRGTITDASGAVVQSASVTIIEGGAGETRRLVSNSAGLYDAPNLPVGTYKLTVTAAGFSTGERTGIEVGVGSERVIDVELAIGAAEETVTASADAAAVDLATSQTGGVESGKVVRELPLNGRDWTILASLQPGVTIVRTENPVVLDVPRGNRGYGVMMAIGGSRPQQSSYWLD